MHTKDSTRATMLQLHAELATNELRHLAGRTTDPEARGHIRKSADKLRQAADEIDAHLDLPRRTPTIQSWGDPHGGDSAADYREFPVS